MKHSMLYSIWLYSHCALACLSLHAETGRDAWLR
jgi:hypothetical protein